MRIMIITAMINIKDINILPFYSHVIGLYTNENNDNYGNDEHKRQTYFHFTLML